VVPIAPVPPGSRFTAWLPRRELIKVRFTASESLRHVGEHGDVVVMLHSYFCDRGDNHPTLGAPGVYLESVNTRPEGPSNGHNSLYYFFLDVSHEAKPGSIPPDPGFDLRVRPDDICFYMTIHGALLTTYHSSVARIPRDAIEQAFTTIGAQPER
jgi:hypothetical protein